MAAGSALAACAAAQEQQGSLLKAALGAIRILVLTSLHGPDSRYSSQVMVPKAASYLVTRRSRCMCILSAVMRRAS
jgi:hypothetical protein